MKIGKGTIRILFCSIFLAGCLPGGGVKAERAIEVARKSGHDLDEKYQPAGSIITEMNTGQILWQENAQVLWEPASMSKLMTILLAYDAMEQGKLTKDTEAVVTEKYLDIAGRYSLSNNRMNAGVSYTVSELIDLVIVPSSAAATYMLVDLIEPDPDKYAALMNEKAVSLGMTQTRYYNPVGVRNELLAPYHPVNQSLNDDNVTSPVDYALLCSYLVKQYPDVLNHTKEPEIVVKKGTPYEETFKTYQLSLEGAKFSLEGTDGLKTGSGSNGFNYSSTAKRGDTRLVEIVMGVTTWEDQAGEEMRHLVGNAIMEQAFQNYEYRKVLPKGKHVIQGEKIITEQDFWDCVPKNKEIPLLLKDGKVTVDLERSYLPGCKPPAISYQKASVNLFGNRGGKENSGNHIGIGSIFIIAAVFLLISGAVTLLCIRKSDQKRRLKRRRRRR